MDQSGEANPNFRHGLTHHPCFGRWYRMVRRCTDPGDPAWKNYGRRGITVHEAWLDPAAYIAYVETELGPAPGPEWSIDRIDNDGNYEPGNLRWATRSEQNANQRVRPSRYPIGASGFRGVKLHKPTGRWQARFRSKSLGYYDTPEEAAFAYDAAAVTVLGDRAHLNFGEVVK